MTDSREAPRGPLTCLLKEKQGHDAREFMDIKLKCPTPTLLLIFQPLKKLPFSTKS